VFGRGKGIRSREKKTLRSAYHLSSQGDAAAPPPEKAAATGEEGGVRRKTGLRLSEGKGRKLHTESERTSGRDILTSAKGKGNSLSYYRGEGRDQKERPPRLGKKASEGKSDALLSP